MLKLCLRLNMWEKLQDERFALLRADWFVPSILTVSVGNFSLAAMRISRPSFLCWHSAKLRYDSLYFSTPKAPFSRMCKILLESPFSASFGSFLPKSMTLDGNLERKNGFIYHTRKIKLIMVYKDTNLSRLYSIPELINTACSGFS